MGCLAGRPSPVDQLSPKEPSSAEPALMRMNTSFMCKSGSFRKDYDVVRVLMSNEHGKVMEVKNKKTGEHFALKEVHLAKSISSSSLPKEVEVLIRLAHPNLVQLFEMYSDKEKYCIVEEFLSGGELFDFINDSGFLNEAIAANILRQLLSAVGHCHEHNVVLRNIKPENILLVQRVPNPAEIRIKLVDFGMSTIVDNNRRLHKALGSELYSAPEVFSGEYGEPCDMWSIGVLLYVMLSASFPFPGETSEEIRSLVTSGEVSLSGGRWDQVSEDAKDLIRQMLIVNPGERITAQQALSHPWIAATRVITQEDLEKSKMLVADLRKLNGEKRLKAALGGFIADRFAAKEQMEEQRRLFEAIDKDQSGTLSRDELIEALSANMPPEDAAAEVDNVLLSVDFDHSQGIDYKEFVAAAALQKKLFSKEIVERAFNYLDADQSGKLSVKELNALLGHAVQKGEKSLKELIKEADVNGDGQLNLKEFTNLLLQD